MENYYILRCDEDGQITIEELTKKEVLERLEQDYYGQNTEILSSIQNKDPNYWEGRLLIIKGQIITPRPVKVRYDID